VVKSFRERVTSVPFAQVEECRDEGQTSGLIIHWSALPAGATDIVAVLNWL
jgi:hypothetical protein